MTRSSNSGQLFIVSGPSGSGKDTLISIYLQQFKNVRLSVSATTRPPRETETDGVHYHFLNKNAFEELIASDGLLEYASYCGNYYGTPLKPIVDWLQSGDNVILNIEVKGAKQVIEKFPDAVSIFIMPPSFEALKNRLTARKTEKDDDVGKRLQTALKEIESAKDYDFIIINDQLEEAGRDLAAVIRSEKCKTHKNIKFIEEVLKNA